MHDDLTQPETRFPIVRPIGVNGMLVTFGDRLTDAVNQAALAFRAAVEDLILPEVSETTMSLASVFVGFDPLTTP
ncbi:MAG: carboxyltransferase domain-containing protein, partial [Pseudomonadota bacterium]